MAPLGALTQAWTAAEAALPLGWHVAGVWRFDDTWIALGEGPDFDGYLSGSGRFAEQTFLKHSAPKAHKTRQAGPSSPATAVTLGNLPYVRRIGESALGGVSDWEASR